MNFNPVPSRVRPRFAVRGRYPWHSCLPKSPSIIGCPTVWKVLCEKKGDSLDGFPGHVTRYTTLQSCDVLLLSLNSVRKLYIAPSAYRRLQRHISSFPVPYVRKHQPKANRISTLKSQLYTHMIRITTAHSKSAQFTVALGNW